MKRPDCFTTQAPDAIPLTPLSPDTLAAWLTQQEKAVRAWVQNQGFDAAPHSTISLPNAQGKIRRVLYGMVEAAPDTWTLSDAPQKLPEGDYFLECDWTDAQRSAAALGWCLGAYQFNRYKTKTTEKSVRLLLDWAHEALIEQCTASTLVRDLVNLPPDDMMPPELAAEAKHLADAYGATFTQIVGEELLNTNYPCIHAVGRASVHLPRLLALKWGQDDHPRVALVGKGVCFDSGGLDIKPSSGMRYMQKDMGGAAHVLGLAQLIMASKLPVQLQVLIPAVENAVSANAFHPGDIIDSRSGLSIEVENTDAEGRLVLCDAITEACNNEPDLLIDFATLTGAARVAVGTEIAAFFSNNETLADQLAQASKRVHDPVWQLPLHADYQDQLKSRVADIMNCSKSGFGGATTAALFLQMFVRGQTDWLHFDVMAWNTRSRPGHPEGGEAMGIRAVFELLRDRYSD